MRLPSPPGLSGRILALIIPERDREAVIGDLAEEYALRLRSDSRFTVSRWYWAQVCRSVFPMAWSSLRRGHWLITLGVALIAYVAAGAVEFAGDWALAQFIASGAQLGWILGLILGLATMAFGGYFAAWIRPGAATAMAGIVLISVAALMATRSESVPLWYQVAFLIAGPLASLAGGTLRLRRQA